MSDVNFSGLLRGLGGRAFQLTEELEGIKRLKTTPYKVMQPAEMSQLFLPS